MRFGRSKKRKEPAQQQLTSPLAAWASDRKKQLAAWLQERFDRLSGRMRMVVVLFVLGGSAVFFGTLLLSPGGSGSGKGIQSLFREGKSITLAVPERAPGISKEMFLRMRAARQYLDSLEQSSSGRLKLDSMERARPGLRDSLIQVIELYRNQFPD